MAQNPLTSAEVFLKIADQFKLGELPTEQSHPLTKNLSDLARDDLNEALSRIKQIDLAAVEFLKSRTEELEVLRQQIHQVLSRQGRIFICGCGATGRLALTLEAINRELKPESNEVIGFIAGGDVALVHALEGFEDHPEYGARHLVELGFSEKDLLICCTEGGETPFVIGAALKATEISRFPVAFMFCNPKELLIRKLERCKQVLTHPQVKSFELCVGPMALCGSTRLQASTVLMLAAGLCLFTPKAHSLDDELNSLLSSVENLNYSKLKEFILAEAEVYQNRESVIYQADPLAISIFTDTTERAPTFSLKAFQPEVSQDLDPSWSFIECTAANGPMSAWENILNRKPRALNWPEINTKTTEEYMLGFDFSRGAQERRNSKWPSVRFQEFLIHSDGDRISWSFKNLETSFETKTHSLLFQHSLLKLLMNAHSTLIMGVLGRYEGNWMTHVFPTNAKLVDRAARYVQGILRREGYEADYEQIVRALFSKMPCENNGRSLVLELVSEFSRS